MFSLWCTLGLWKVTPEKDVRCGINRDRGILCSTCGMWFHRVQGMIENGGICRDRGKLIDRCASSTCLPLTVMNLSCQSSTTAFLFGVDSIIRDKKVSTDASALVERMFSELFSPETLYNDKGLQGTHTTEYWPRGNFVLKCVQSTQHNIFAMYSDVKDHHWVELLPFVQFVPSTALNQPC